MFQTSITKLRARMGLAATIAWSLLAVISIGCPSAQIATLIIPGDFSGFVTENVQISIGGGPALDHPVEYTAEGAVVRFSAAPGDRIAFSGTLDSEATTDPNEQEVVERRQFAGNVTLDAAPETVLNGIDEEGPLQWAGLFFVSKDGATAIFPRDPCDMFAVLAITDGGEACEVASECTFYSEPDAGGDMLATILGEDGTPCSYDGSNLFDGLTEEDAADFIDTCKLDNWKSADAATCYVRNDTTYCLTFAWTNESSQP